MKSIFLFSKHFKSLGDRIVFLWIVFVRAIKIILRYDREIYKLYLDYSTKNVFTNNFLVIRFDFRNALWYEFKGIKRTTQKTSLVIDTSKVNIKNIILVVQGLNRKQEFSINVTSDTTIHSDSFKVKANQLKIENSFMPITTLAFSQFELKSSIVKINHNLLAVQSKKISIHSNKIQLNLSSFKQTDFI